MKTLLIVLGLMVVSFLGAMSLDEAVDMACQTGSFVNHAGSLYFVANSLGEEELPDEDYAQGYLAQIGLVFLVLRNNWETYSSNTNTQNIKRLGKVACGFTNGYQEYLLEMPMYELDSVLDESDWDGRGDECLSTVQSYVRNHADIRNLGMWLDE